MVNTHPDNILAEGFKLESIMCLFLMGNISKPLITEVLVYLINIILTFKNRDFVNFGSIGLHEYLVCNQLALIHYM